MAYWFRLLASAAAVALLAGCESGRHSAAGFRLPDTASADRGKVAFVSLGCNQCHQVSGVELPKPANAPVNVVKLGGEVSNVVTDGFLVTSILYPGYVVHQSSSDVHALIMPQLADKMTAQQLIDLVEFLQSSYQVRKTRPNSMYY